MTDLSSHQKIFTASFREFNRSTLIHHTVQAAHNNITTVGRCPITISSPLTSNVILLGASSTPFSVDALGSEAVATSSKSKQQEGVVKQSCHLSCHVKSQPFPNALPVRAPGLLAFPNRANGDICGTDSTPLYYTKYNNRSQMCKFICQQEYYRTLTHLASTYKHGTTSMSEKYEEEHAFDDFHPHDETPLANIAAKFPSHDFCQYLYMRNQRQRYTNQACQSASNEK